MLAQLRKRKKAFKKENIFLHLLLKDLHIPTNFRIPIVKKNLAASIDVKTEVENFIIE